MARRLLNNAMWEQLAAALAEVKDPRGAPSSLSDRDFVEAVLFLTHRFAMARFAAGIRRMECGIHAFPPLGSSGSLARAVGGAGARLDTRAAQGVCRQHQYPGPSARSWCPQKNGADQALGRSRGGLTTKLHVASTDENTAVGLALSGGERHDINGFAPVYAQAQEAGTVVRVTADRAHDADPLRERLTADQGDCVIPPRKNRRHPAHCSRRLYRRRHKVENWIRKLQDFRRLATRYEKLATCYLALAHLAR